MTHLPGSMKGSLKYRIALAIAFRTLVAILGSQPAPREQVGPLPGGAFLLNSGWRLDPVGRQVALDTLPMEIDDADFKIIFREVWSAKVPGGTGAAGGISDFGRAPG